MIRRSMARVAAASAVALLVLSLTAGAALAGEITGTGRSLKTDDGMWGTGLHARSLCAYSGLNDDRTAEEPGRVQNWGTIPKAFRDVIGPLGYHPGRACNPNFGPPTEP
ncbi:MAG: hypothetical protein ACLGIJ_13325 [Candidatus Limnocylindria bacterium]